MGNRTRSCSVLPDSETKIPEGHLQPAIRNPMTFDNAQGDALAARLDMPPDGRPRACAIFAHCFTCSKNLNAVSHISRALVNEGIAVLRFDFTGLGESEGEFAETTFSSNVADLLAAAAFLERDHQAPAILIGHSLGGAAVLCAAGHLPSVRAVATLGAPFDPAHIRHLFADAYQHGRHQPTDGRGEAGFGSTGR